jgi:hypothetical protein
MWLYMSKALHVYRLFGLEAWHAWLFVAVEIKRETYELSELGYENMLNVRRSVYNIEGMCGYLEDAD